MNRDQQTENKEKLMATNHAMKSITDWKRDLVYERELIQDFELFQGERQWQFSKLHKILSQKIFDLKILRK